jgi:hypothetical protein
VSTSQTCPPPPALPPLLPPPSPSSSPYDAFVQPRCLCDSFCSPIPGAGRLWQHHAAAKAQSGRRLRRAARRSWQAGARYSINGASTKAKCALTLSRQQQGGICRVHASAQRPQRFFGQCNARLLRWRGRARTSNAVRQVAAAAARSGIGAGQRGLGISCGGNVKSRPFVHSFGGQHAAGIPRNPCIVTSPLLLITLLLSFSERSIQPPRRPPRLPRPQGPPPLLPLCYRMSMLPDVR